jgi:ubiquitin carboxyl-terminal hydrolase 5/13
VQEEVAAYETEKNKSEDGKVKSDPNLIVRPRIKLSSCLETLAKVETVEQFYSSALNDKTTATKYVHLQH